MNDSPQKRAVTLLDKPLGSGKLSPDWGFGPMSVSVYDTAWLSMVRKPDASGANTTWLFPECFQYVLAEQLPSGGWASYRTPVEGILNTAAALLSLRIHLRTDSNHHDWLLRSHKAEAALKQILLEWDVHSTDQAGLDILVTSLLRLLDQEGVSINVPHLDALRAISDSLLAQIPSSKLYETPSTLHYFLEAFIGYIDFSRVRPCKGANGSIMGSPASTAAYLMNSPSWDSEAEAYLGRIINSSGDPKPKGSLRDSPTTLFEVVTALTPAGLPINQIDTCGLSDVLRYHLAKQGRLLSAATDSVSNLYGAAKAPGEVFKPSWNHGLGGLIRPYEDAGHLTTDPEEGSYSFSTGCNVLITVLTREDRAQKLLQIAKLVGFLIGELFQGSIRDKNNLSELYCMMLFARSLELLFQDHQVVRELFDLVVSLQEDIPLVALEILSLILRDQAPNGSWDDTCEATAYGVLALSSLATLPHIQQLGISGITDSISLGKSFLFPNRLKWRKESQPRKEKIPNNSDALNEAYCISAAFIPLPSNTQPGNTTSTIKEALIPDQLLLGMKQAGKLVSRTQLFSGFEPYSLRIAEMKACFFLKLLQRQPPEVFPQMGKRIKKSNFIIPLALTACSGLHDYAVSLSVLREMLILSVLNFQVDEYMERVVERHFGDNLDGIRRLVQQIFVEVPQETDGIIANGHQKEKKAKSTESSNGPEADSPVPSPEAPSAGEYDAAKQHESMDDVRDVLRRFVKHILRHPAVLSSPKDLRDRLARDLRTFILAHVTHAEDNQRLRAQSSSTGDSPTAAAGAPMQYEEPGRTFYQWVRSTSADHTSCPFAFVFFNCLIHVAASRSSSSSNSGSGGGILASARTAYLAEDACRHLASLCRMYNDLGSVARDADERNLNSTSFPEFFARPDDSATATATAASTADAKAELLWIAEYERRGLTTAMEMLGHELGPGQTMRSLRFFVDLTDLYGQIYVIKDVGTRIQ